MRRVVVRAGAVASLMSLGGGAVAWGEQPFVRIVDTTTVAPGQTVPLSQIGTATIGDGTVAFLGQSQWIFDRGYYAWRSDSGLTLVADTQTLLPGDAGLLAPAVYPGPAAAGGIVAGWHTAGTFSGVYAWIEGETAVVATTGTPVPSHNAVFRHAGGMSAHAGEIAFMGGWGLANDVGIFGWTPNGGMRVFADTATPIPSPAHEFETHFSLLSTGISLRNGRVAFTGGHVRHGVYIADGQGVTMVANSLTLAANGAEYLTYFYEPVLGDHSVVFKAASPTLLYAIYTTVDGTVQAVATAETLVPGTTEHFNTHAFFGYALAGSTVLFTGGTTLETTGVYTWTSADGIGVLIAPGHELDGRVVERAAIGHGGADGDQAVVWVRFTDGMTGLYLTTIPGAGTGGILMIAAAALLRRRRRC